jgi:hypothetical protein
MSVIVIDEIFDPIGNSHKHKQMPIVHWQYVGMERKYAVQTKWISPQDETSMYNAIDMHCYGMKEGKASWKITKDNFYIDNKIPEDHISLLAMESAAPYYPFEFMATKDGKIDSVTNMDQLQKRFAKAKPILLRNYEGDIAIEYIDAIENFLQDEEQLKKIVTNDIWSSLFFVPIVGEYNYETKIKEATIEFPFFGFEQLFVFKGSAKIIAKTKETNTIIFEGSLLLPAITEDVISLDGKIEVKYDLDIETYRIRAIMCDASISTEQGEYKIIVDGYEITEKKVIQIKEEKPKPEPVGWLAFFNKD